MHRARRLPTGAEGNAHNSGEGAQLAVDGPGPDMTFTPFFTPSRFLEREGKLVSPEKRALGEADVAAAHQ
jgi:hypothetical protein